MSSLRSSSREPVSLFAFQDIIFSVTAIMLFAAIWFAISTRVTRFSASTDRTAADGELRETISRLADLEAREALLRAWADAGRPAPDTAAASAPPGRPAALLAAGSGRPAADSLRSRLAAEEAGAARRLLAMQAEEARWSATRRRILEWERQTDAVLLVNRPDNSLLEPVLVLVSKDWIDIERAARPDLRRRVPGPVDRTALARLVAGFDPSVHFLWFGIRPSGAGLFDAARDSTRTGGFAATYEPISETQAVNFHSRERALELLP